MTAESLSSQPSTTQPLPSRPLSTQSKSSGARLRDILNAAVFIAVIAGLTLLNLLTKPPAILVSERRPPAPLPALSASTVFSGSFMSRFGDYAADSFIFRESFRTLKALTVFGAFVQTDKSGLYFGKAGIGEFQATDPVAAGQTVEKIKRAAEAVSGLAPDCRIYYAVVPDKSMYAGKYLPGFDLAATEGILAEVLDGIPYISLADCLGADSFYRTDLHWDQSRIESVVRRLGDAMGVSYDLRDYETMYAGAFQGVYPGQMALPAGSDLMRYLNLPGLRARRLDDRTLLYEDCPVYDTERFRGIDPYDLFLLGPQAVVELVNPAVSEGVLYLFRDSYGSSLAPLLANAYSRVVLIDLRYIDLRVLDQFVEFQPGADVLFLYSSQILNNPSVLRM